MKTKKNARREERRRERASDKEIRVLNLFALQHQYADTNIDKKEICYCMRHRCCFVWFSWFVCLFDFLFIWSIYFLRRGDHLLIKMKRRWKNISIPQPSAVPNRTILISFHLLPNLKCQTSLFEIRRVECMICIRLINSHFHSIDGIQRTVAVIVGSGGVVVDEISLDIALLKLIESHTEGHSFQWISRVFFRRILTS